MQHLFTRVLPAIVPILVIALGIPLWQLGLLVSVYMFMGGIVQAPMGIIAGRVERQYLLVPSIVLMSIGYLIFALASPVGGALPSSSLLGQRSRGPFRSWFSG